MLTQQLDLFEIASIQQALDCVYTDLCMLKDGSWLPDNDSVEDSITLLSFIAKHFNHDLKDARS